jgi:hypothetical protein
VGWGVRGALCRGDGRDGATVCLLSLLAMLNSKHRGGTALCRTQMPWSTNTMVTAMMLTIQLQW